MKNIIARIRQWRKQELSSTSESDQRDMWTKEAFWFLVEEYGFTYEGSFEGHADFVSEKIIIQLQPGRKTPYSYVYRVGEPGFTRLTLFQVLYYLDGKELENDFDAHSLQYNLNFLAYAVRKHSSTIQNDINKWWLPVHLLVYKGLETQYKNSGQLNDFLASFKNIHDYLKGKGAI
jgi:hypothetical protein